MRRAQSLAGCRDLQRWCCLQPRTCHPTCCPMRTTRCTSSPATARTSPRGGKAPSSRSASQERSMGPATLHQVRRLGWRLPDVSWNMKAQRFVHTGEKGDEVDRIVNYVAWDDSRWSATRAGTGSCQTRIADADEPFPERSMASLTGSINGAGLHACGFDSFRRAAGVSAGTVG